MSAAIKHDWTKDKLLLGVGGRAKNGSTPNPRRLSVREGERERSLEKEREMVRERK